jgi:tRNA threonylcarbamoyladenosine biosynthesis protein TsaB
MIILAADTSTAVNTVAVCDEQGVLAETAVRCGRKHSERLIQTLDWVLGEAACPLDEVDLLAISAGPGSFTGLRVGIATWKGLAVASRKPLMGVPTLDALSRCAYAQSGTVCTILDAKMNEVFGAVYDFGAGDRTKRTPDLVCSLSDLMTHAGDGPLMVGEWPGFIDQIQEVTPSATFAPAHLSYPRASAVAAEARALFDPSSDYDSGHVSPVYLRRSQAEEARAAAT